MGIVLDVIILAILILSIIFGCRKGLIGVAFNLCAFLVALILTFILYKPVASFVIQNTDLYDNLYRFNDLEEFQRCFKMNRFHLKQKVILLKYMRGIYLMDRLDKYDILLQQRHLNTEEYKYLLQNQFIEEPNISDSVNLIPNGEASNKKEGEINMENI